MVVTGPVLRRYERGHTAVLRVHEKIRSHWRTAESGSPETVDRRARDRRCGDRRSPLSADPKAAARWNDKMRSIASRRNLHELCQGRDIGATYIVGGSPRSGIELRDPDRPALYGT